MIPGRPLRKAFPPLVCHGVIIRRCLQCYDKIKNKTMIRVVNQLINKRCEEENAPVITSIYGLDAQAMVDTSTKYQGLSTLRVGRIRVGSL